VGPAVFQRSGLGVLQGLREFKAFNVWRVVPNASFALVAVVFLILDIRDFFPYALAWALSRSIFTIGTMRAANRAARRTESGVGEPPSRSAIQKFGLKAMFGGAPPVETYRLDQSVVALFLTPVALGYYVTALAFTNLPRFVAQSFGIVANPAIARQATHKAAKRSMWRFFWLSLPCCLAVVVPLWITVPTLAEWLFGPEFAEAGEISRILLVATMLFCARRVLADAAQGAGYPGIGSIAELVSFFSVLPLFAVFVPAWGVDGVAYALVLSSAIALITLILGLLRAGSTGRVPPAWLEIRSEAVSSESKAIVDVTGSTGTDATV
jgi:O-antigen/teichoic acid export membrane protein